MYSLLKWENTEKKTRAEQAILFTVVGVLAVF